MKTAHDSRPDVIGQLLPDALYTREGCWRYAGLGTDALREARQSGLVKPIRCGRRVYFRGAELIRWIEGGSDGSHGS